MAVARMAVPLRLRLLRLTGGQIGFEQSVQMDDDIPHFGVIDAALQSAVEPVHGVLAMQAADFNEARS